MQISRFERQLIRTPSLLNYLFVPAEQKSSELSLAKRFAAKEAIAKAIGAPVGLDWLDCQLLLGAGGLPRVSIKGTVAAVATKKGISSWHISISHDGDIAMATVIAES